MSPINKSIIKRFCFCFVICQFVIIPGYDRSDSKPGSEINPHTKIHSDACLNQPGCDGCVRRYIIADISSDAGELNELSIKNHLHMTVITPCFHALSTGEEIPKEFKPFAKKRPYEYFFMVSYEEGLKEKIKSRLQIDLFFNGSSEEHVRTWMTETDNPNASYPLHKNRMFMNPDAVLKKFWPMELTVLNDFEKRPYSCEIKPEKESVNPGEEIEVVITDIYDIEGLPSREFNRIIIQARDGRILDGTPLAADFALRAFRVEDGTLKFQYKAPTLCDETEDMIFVYNSCDILREDLWPLAISDLKDKIAEKQIRLLCADWSGTFTFSYRSSSRDTETDPGVVITTEEDITSQGSASLELYYDNEFNEFRVIGAPSGNYTHIYKKILTVKSGGSSAKTERTCRCFGGYTDEGPDERSFLDIQGNDYQMQITLTTDPDNDCKGTTKEYVDGSVVNTYGFDNPFVLSEFLEGSLKGNLIEGSKSDSGEGWSSEIEWNFQRRGN